MLNPGSILPVYTSKFIFNTDFCLLGLEPKSFQYQEMPIGPTLDREMVITSGVMKSRPQKTMESIFKYVKLQNISYTRGYTTCDPQYHFKFFLSLIRSTPSIVFREGGIEREGMDDREGGELVRNSLEKLLFLYIVTTQISLANGHPYWETPDNIIQRRKFCKLWGKRGGEFILVLALRQSQKQQNQGAGQGTDYICLQCGRDGHPRIGLLSHTRCCSKSSIQSTLP